MIKLDLKELELKIIWKQLVCILWLLMGLNNSIIYYFYPKSLFLFLCIISLCLAIFYSINEIYYRLTRFIYLLYKDER